MQVEQVISLRIWNGKDYKAPIPENIKDELRDQALTTVTEMVVDKGFREGNFTLDTDSDITFYRCAWTVQYKQDD